jgi:protoporphyrinogen oxidase
MAEHVPTWAVVGGGVLGMRLATELAEHADVTLVEAAPELGGLASTWDIGGVRWDRHYHVILPTDHRTIQLVDELGLHDELRWRSVPAGCEYDGVVHPATTPPEILRLPFLGWAAKLRLGLTALRALSVRDPASLDDITAVRWLRRWSGAQATERFWRPLLVSKLGGNVDVASAVFIATTLRRLAGARRQGGTSGDGFGFVSGGYAVVLERMAGLLATKGVKTQLGHRVTGVHRRSDGVAVATDDGVERVFDNVVVTAAAPIAAKLCPDLSEAESLACAGVEYQGIVCLSLLLERPLTQNYITYLLRPQPFTAVIDMSALVGSDQLSGHGLVYLPAYVRPDDPLLQAPEEEIVESFLAGLRTIYPEAAGTVIATRLSKVRQVLPIPTLGYAHRLPPIRTSVPGLHLVSSALITDGTLNVNETLGVAERALPVLLGRS